LGLWQRGDQLLEAAVPTDKAISAAAHADGLMHGSQFRIDTRDADTNGA
jgi:hypothetical protein